MFLINWSVFKRDIFSFLFVIIFEGPRLSSRPLISVRATRGSEKVKSCRHALDLQWLKRKIKDCSRSPCFGPGRLTHKNWAVAARRGHENEALPLRVAPSRALFSLASITSQARSIWMKYALINPTWSWCFCCTLPGSTCRWSRDAKNRFAAGLRTDIS